MPSIEQPKLSVAVVTATIGHPFLSRAIDSVRSQSYGCCEHFLVVDGPQFSEHTQRSLHAEDVTRSGLHVLTLPQRTGHSGWCSHRIYAALPMLLDADYVCYLDQDNWFEPDHVESLVQLARDTGSPCVHALR